MPETRSIFLLVLQSTLAIIEIELLRRAILPRLVDAAMERLIIQVWAPIAVVAPMLFFSAKVSTTMADMGWMVTGAPIVCALLGVGAMLVISGPVHQVRGNHLWVACAGTGLLLLLLGLAHDLTIWMGQCAFALGAVILWLNTPELEHREERKFDPLSTWAGWAMVIALGCGLGQGVLSIYVQPEWRGTSGAIMIACAAMIIASSAKVLGGQAALRVGGWASVYGITLGLGVLSLLAMVPQVVSILHGEPVRRVVYVANGFGRYAPEAAILVAAAALIGFYQSWSRREAVSSKTVGILIIVFAALLSGWRLSWS